MSSSVLASVLKQIYAYLPDEASYDVGVVCGSGLSNLTQKVENQIIVPYRAIKGLPHSEVEGHANEFVFGTVGNKRVVCMRGRFHFYEGWNPSQTVMGIKVLAALGVKCIIITNAAGGVDREFQVGDLMMMDGQISFVSMAGNNALCGPNDNKEGPRFPPVTRTFDADFRDTFAQVYAENKEAVNFDHELRTGCYVGVCGPNYETPHEIEMFRRIGGSSVGMSTVNEVIQAAHSGVQVLGLSLITNQCIGTSPEEKDMPVPNHQEVIDAVNAVEGFVVKTVSDFIAKVDLSKKDASVLSQLYSRENVKDVVVAEEKPVETVAAATGACPVAASTCPFSKIPCKEKLCNLFTGILGGVLGAFLYATLRK